MAAHSPRTPPPQLLCCGRAALLTVEVGATVSVSYAEPDNVDGETQQEVVLLRRCGREGDASTDNASTAVNGAAAAVSRASLSQPSQRHNLVESYLSKPTFCALASCRRFIWGVTAAQQHAILCVACRLACHGRCKAEFAREPCDGVAKPVLESVSVPMPHEVLNRVAESQASLLQQSGLGKAAERQTAEWEVVGVACGTATVDVRSAAGLLEERRVFIVHSDDG
jgi:hypothetical protein